MQRNCIWPLYDRRRGLNISCHGIRNNLERRCALKEFFQALVRLVKSIQVIRLFNLVSRWPQARSGIPILRLLWRVCQQPFYVRILEEVTLAIASAFCMTPLVIEIFMIWQTAHLPQTQRRVAISLSILRYTGQLLALRSRSSKEDGEQGKQWTMNLSINAPPTGDSSLSPRSSRKETKNHQPHIACRSASVGWKVTYDFLSSI